MVFTRNDWNQIIRRVNQLAANPPSGCNPLAPLDEVEPNHVWKKNDIQQVRDKLTQVCKDNAFNAALRLWSQSVIDEIEAAIAHGWCDCGCEDIPCEFGQGPSLVAIVPAADDWCNEYLFCRFDWAPLINGLPVGAQGYSGRSWFVRRYNTATGEEVSGFTVFPTGNAGLIACDGGIRAPMNTAGPLGMAGGSGGGNFVLRIYAQCSEWRNGQLWQSCCE